MFLAAEPERARWAWTIKGRGYDAPLALSDFWFS